MRTCVACGQTRPKRELVRVVRTSVGAVHIDSTGKLSGRGAYVCRDAACADAGLRGQRLAHALAVPIPAEIAEQLRQLTAGPVRGASR
ncbi:MAG TPA: YlxR family protein [bacterium]